MKWHNCGWELTDDHTSTTRGIPAMSKSVIKRECLQKGFSTDIDVARKDEIKDSFEKYYGTNRTWENLSFKDFYSAYENGYKFASKEGAELKKAIDLMIIDRDTFHDKNVELEKQIEALKCCGNCDCFNEVGEDHCMPQYITRDLCPNWQMKEGD